MIYVNLKRKLKRIMIVNKNIRFSLLPLHQVKTAAIATVFTW